MLGPGSAMWAWLGLGCVHCFTEAGISLPCTERREKGRVEMGQVRRQAYENITAKLQTCYADSHIFSIPVSHHNPKQIYGKPCTTRCGED